MEIYSLRENKAKRRNNLTTIKKSRKLFPGFFYCRGLRGSMRSRGWGVSSADVDVFFID
jgi:hypothetical protein